MLQPWRTGTVIKIEDASESTRRFWIQIPDLDVFDFKPGQFVTLDLPIHEKTNKRWRSYSIASAPDGTNIIELVIVLLEGGLGTTYLFNEIKVGSNITLRGPVGVFTLPESLDKDLYLICTGTGIAPFRSMATFIHQQKIAHKNIHLVFGCRKLSDQLYGAELKALESLENKFYYHPVFSREDAVPDGAHKGYVHSVYEQLLAYKNPSQFYLCGWKNMIDEAKQRLLAAGYDKKDIHLEIYG
jgi:CDP-4-dehydro-6-deoxyglucose reductase